MHTSAAWIPRPDANAATKPQAAKPEMPIAKHAHRFVFPFALIIARFAASRLE